MYPANFLPRPYARCSKELPIAEEDDDSVHIDAWQANGLSYCCQEHVRLSSG
jgi:hypothetical protein